jgi:hypothetical protein
MSHWTLKIFKKVLEFEEGIFKAWKVLENERYA